MGEIRSCTRSSRSAPARAACHWPPALGALAGRCVGLSAILFFVVGLFAPGPAARAEAASSLDDWTRFGAPTVTAMEVRAVGQLDPSLDLAELFAFGVGDRLSREGARETLARCHATGLFAEVELYVQPSAPTGDPGTPTGGAERVEAVLVLVGHLRVDRVEFVGDRPLRSRLLRRFLHQRADGAVLDPGAVERSEQALGEALRGRGFPEARAEIEIVPTGRPRWVDLRVRLHPGPRARLGEVRVSSQARGRRLVEADSLADSQAEIGSPEPVDGRSAGADEFRGLEPETQLRSTAGEVYDPEKLEEERSRLRRYFARRGFLAARVAKARTEWQPETSTLDVVLPVTLGPRFEIEVRNPEAGPAGGGGRFDLGWLRRRGFLPFFDQRPFDEALFAQSCERLLEHFQARGHYRARVECRQLDVPGSAPAPGRAGADQRLEIVLEPGPVYGLEQVELLGAESLPRGELEAVLQTGPDRLFSPGDGRLVSRQLEEDLEGLRSFYLLEGFSQVEVGPPRVSESGPGEPVSGEPVSGGDGAGAASARAGDRRLRVEIPIVEGPRQRVVSLAVEGSWLFDFESLAARLPLRAGDGFHPLLLDDTLNVLRTLYEEEGYPQAAIQARLDWNDEQTLVDVVFEIEEGPRREIGRVVLRGLHRTRAAVVRRHARLEPGDVPSRRDLLRAERDLYRLGIFSEVDVSFLPSAVGTTERDVLIRVEEGRPWRVSYGLSYHSDDGLGGLFGLGRNNLRGLGDRFQLDLRASENDQRLRFLYDQPSIFSLPVPITYSLFFRDELRPSYRVRESGLRLSFTRDRPLWRLRLYYDYRLVELAEEPLDPLDLERDDSEVEIASWTPTLFVDRRDDPLDPRLGWSTAVQVERAFPAFDADASFTKLFWQQTQYRSLGDWGTLAGSLRLGAIEAGSSGQDGDPQLPEDLPSSAVPISERFFAGGRTTHRAFERDRLGIVGRSLVERPDGGLLEVGGNGLFLLNLDYRFPISGALGGVVFADVGNVWADWRDFDVDDLRWGAGLGVRYASPIGPIRLEVGWKIDPTEFEDDDPIFLLSFGNPF